MTLQRRRPRTGPPLPRSRYQHPRRFTTEERRLIDEALPGKLVVCPVAPEDRHTEMVRAASRIPFGAEPSPRSHQGAWLAESWDMDIGDD